MRAFQSNSSPIETNSCSTLISTQGIELWTETFGNRNNPAIILIMGSGGQGILWPQQFCEQIANSGYFVIRYDHRDTGLSSTIDFQSTPYNLLDMTNDVLGILDYYLLDKVHVVGASMGGAIAMLFGAHYPDRVASLVLMMTTVDMQPAFDAYLGIASEHDLSKPTKTVLDAAKNIVALPETLDEKIEFYLECARVNSGGNVEIDEVFLTQTALQVFSRMKNPNGANNHFQAIQSSYELHRAAPSKITAPTHIIHGDADPVFPLDHGYAIHAAIPHSSIAIIPGLGHGFPSPIFNTPIIEEIIKGITK